MNKEYSTYRHPKHAQISAMILAGATDTAVAAELHVARRSIARVRGILGVQPKTNSTTREAKVARFSFPDGYGHTGWNGRTATSGAPVIRHLKREMPASHVVFEARTGRPPVGIVKAECGYPDCLTPAHVGDELERRQVRMQLRALAGLPPQPWDLCSKGKHGWEEHGRVQPDLEPYCATCNTERVRNAREAKLAEATTV